MVYEHNELRDLITKIENEYSEPKELKKDLSYLAYLLSGHIGKENTVLFPLAENMITEEAEKELYEGFGKGGRENWR
ncbi:hemerythrin domain-containing protein [Sulfurisphaera ohwakuensis]|uniref:hemerythrin domain-containing protein n=1 Tax=Sulfurisphaera ohwakuensis TaxID=69656 RepID=UPI0036F37EC4